MANTDHFIKALTAPPTRLSGAINSTSVNIPLESLEGIQSDTAVVMTIDRVDADGNLTPELTEVVLGTLGNSGLENVVRGVGGRKQSHKNGAVVEVSVASSEQWNRLIKGVLKILNQDGTLKTGVVDGKALKAGSVSNGHMVDGAIDSKKIKWKGINGDRLADNSVDSRALANSAVKPEHLHSASFAKIQYVETPNTDLKKQYEYVYTPKITIPKAGKYLIIASYQTQNWENGLNCDINMKIVKDSAATNPQDVNIDYANFKSSGFHDGMMQKVATLSANDKVRVRAEIGQAVHVQISVRLSVIPISAF